MSASRRRVVPIVLAALVIAAATVVSVPPRPAEASGPPRVLLVGDSILDQHGAAAAFVLRQAGVDARSVGVWGSGLLTREQYDFGRHVPGRDWYARAADLIATFDPQVVAVYMNHNYRPPYPRDAAGREITNLASPSGQAMIRTQAREFVRILQRRGARVYFVRPMPAGRTDTQDLIWNAIPIWAGYSVVLPGLGVGVIDSSGPIRDPQGHRRPTVPDCTGRPVPVHLANDVHLTRYGAGLTGTALAAALARLVGVSLRDNPAPGDHAAALVPTATGNGYWIVGCDGGVYAFGDAPRLPGRRTQVAGRRGVVGAVRTPTGAGLWLVTGNGTIVPTGDAPALELGSRPSARLVAVAHRGRSATGIWATTASGALVRTTSAPALGSMAGRRLNAPIRDLVSTPTGKGYWQLGADGGIFSFGDARFWGSTGGMRLNAPVVGMAATPTGRGYWLVGADGGIFAFGDARYLGNGIAPALPWPYGAFAPQTDAVRIVTRPGPRQGYWILTENGKVYGRGAARALGGTNNLAFLTP